MKLYKSKIPEIAREVIARLSNEGDIEVTAERRADAELDLVAIMDEYLRRDQVLRDEIREHMSRHEVPYDQFGKVRSKLAESWGHPTGDDVQRFLARQFVENFMISNFVDEVFADDKDLYKKIREIVEKFDVDERAIRDEAQNQVKNIAEGTVDYEIALAKAIKEVKRRHGLIQ